MTIRIEIQCEPQDWAWHLNALLRGVSDTFIIQEALKETPRNGAAEIIEEALKNLSEEAQAAAEPTPAPEPPKPAAPEESPRRRGRRPAAEAAPAPVTPAPEPEVVHPQDAADVAAEATTRAQLTHHDVRKMIKAYGDKFGVEASVKDLRLILGRSVSEIPDTQEDLGEAIAKLSHVMATGQRPTAAPPAPTAAAAEPEPESGDLFGETPAPQPPLRATIEDLQAVAADYARKFDPSANPPLTSGVAKDDLSKLIASIFGAGITTVKQLREMAGDPAERYGVVVQAARQALIDNPFKR